MHQRGVEQRVLSDANTYYIDAILRAKGLADGHFSAVVTNPAAFDGDGGRLAITPFHPAAAPPHGCPHCPTNLCKGAVLRRWIDELAPSAVLYVGDGSGDFCPSLHLDDRSVVAARGAPHSRLLAKCTAARAAGEMRASVVEWGDADDGAALLKTIADFLGAGSPM